MNEVRVADDDVIGCPRISRDVGRQRPSVRLRPTAAAALNCLATVSFLDL